VLLLQLAIDGFWAGMAWFPHPLPTPSQVSGTTWSRESGGTEDLHWYPPVHSLDPSSVSSPVGRRKEKADAKIHEVQD
jgi:hypothetical protein